MQSRYYNPEIGRFLNPDSIITGSIVGLNNIVGNNLYMYAYNMPTKYMDSSGNYPVLLAGKGHQGNARLSDFYGWSDEAVLRAYKNLCNMGRLTKEQNEMKKKLEHELKARGLKNKAKRKGYSRSNFEVNTIYSLEVFTISLEQETAENVILDQDPVLDTNTITIPVQEQNSLQIVFNIFILAAAIATAPATGGGSVVLAVGLLIVVNEDDIIDVGGGDY